MRVRSEHLSFNIFYNMDSLNEIAEFRASKEVLQELQGDGVVKKINEGDLLLAEGSYVRSIPIVLKGSIRVVKTDEEDHEMLLYYLKEGETCIMSLLGGMHNETSKIKAVGNESGEILLVPVEKIGPLVRDHPEWINYILRMYHQRFEELLEVVNAVAFKKLDDRLLQLLERKAKIFGTKTIAITHETLAKELGTARVVVSRLLKQMEKEKLVQLGRNRIRLL